MQNPQLGFEQYTPLQDQEPSLEDLLARYVQGSKARLRTISGKKLDLGDVSSKFIHNTDTSIKTSEI